jgi:hypothetical protein
MSLFKEVQLLSVKGGFLLGQKVELLSLKDFWCFDES